MNYRDYLQQLIYKIINPLIHGMIKIGITPNFITTTGFILNVVAAGMFVYAGICGGRNDLAIVGWAGGVIPVSYTHLTFTDAPIPPLSTVDSNILSF